MLSRYSPTLFHSLKLHLDNFLFLSKGQGETPMDWRQKRDVSAGDRQWFNISDTDRDGTISAKELGMTILRYCQLTPRQFGLVQGMGVFNCQLDLYVKGYSCYKDMDQSDKTLMSTIFVAYVWFSRLHLYPKNLFKTLLPAHIIAYQRTAMAMVK